jgi:hypothetical protein
MGIERKHVAAQAYQKTYVENATDIDMKSTMISATL